MVTNKKEIVYNNIDRFAVIVASGEYRGMQYVCLNQGSHPSCYVMCSQEFLDKHTNEFNLVEGIRVHGGITYTGMADRLLGLEDYDSPCFGWDYGHAGDWAGTISDEQNLKYGHIKYTTEMLIKDCENAIDQYFYILKKDASVENPNPALTKDLLTKIGFVPVLDGIDDSFRLEGDNNGKKWKIYIDLNTPSWSYVIHQEPRRKYEGEITTLDDLKSIVQLFDIPVDLSKI